MGDVGEYLGEVGEYLYDGEDADGEYDGLLGE